MSDVPQAYAQMPKYRCHKEVWALKIKEVCHLDGGGAALVSDDQRYADINVPGYWVDRHQPAGDGYYIQYSDGYTSWSPTKAFEEGYTLISGAP